MGVVYAPGAVQEKLEPMQYAKALHEINSALVQTALIGSGMRFE